MTENHLREAAVTLRFARQENQDDASSAFTSLDVTVTSEGPRAQLRLQVESLAPHALVVPRLTLPSGFTLQHQVAHLIEELGNAGWNIK